MTKLLFRADTSNYQQMVIERFGLWLERIDPGAHRRIKGLRLVTAYGIAAMLGGVVARSYHISNGAQLSFLAAGFALWGSVSEGQATRAVSTRDLLILNVAAALGAAVMILAGPLLSGPHRPGSELILVSGAFLVGYLKQFGVLGAGIGSQIYIGQLLAFGSGLGAGDLMMVAIAGLIGAIASIVPRILSGPAEHPPSFATINVEQKSPGIRMGLQAGIAALVVVLVNDLIGLRESAWAITACTYVIAGSATGTSDRVRRRMIGTLVGVPLGIATVPIAQHLPALAWVLAALAMVIYAIALPNRYDIACAAYAFTLMVTLAVSGETSASILFARAWETLIGGALALITAKLVLPLKERSASVSPPQ